MSDTLDRHVTLVTPESTALRLDLAGPGSRFAATLVDALWQALALAVLAAIGAAPLLLGGGWDGLRAFTIRYLWPLLLGAAWAVVWLYPVVFETCWRGQSPGKRALGLRVIRDDGRAVEFADAALRNILRVVDLLPVVTPYLLGAIMILASPERRRLGDQVAGTWVVRERPTPWIDRLVAQGVGPVQVTVTFTATQLERLGASDVDVIGRFLRRCDGLPLESRREVAEKLAGPLRHRLDSPGAESDAEGWLAALWQAWTARRQRW